MSAAALRYTCGTSFLNRYESSTLDKIPCLTKVSQTVMQRDGLLKSAMGVSTAAAKIINALSPVNRLPPEILGMIPTYQEDQTLKDLVTVSSVCSYWRSTFLATPSLWTNLNGKGLKKTKAWVQRSKALPIHLLVEGSPDPKVLKFLGSHSSKMRAVILPYLTAQDLPLFKHGHISKLLRPTPLLREICVEASDLETLDKPIIIKGNFPSLEVLRLSGFQTSIVNLHAPNVREVLLTGTFDLARILELLDSFPLLERLALRLDLQHQALVGTERKVILGEMVQASFFYHGFTILQHLSLPVGSDIKMVDSEIPLHSLDGTTNFHTQFVSQVFNDLPMSRQIESISFHTTQSCRVVFLSGPNGTLELVTHSIDDAISCTSLLRLFTKHSVDTLRELRISNIHIPPRDVHVISDFVKSIAGLQSIVMQQSFASSCLLALGTTHCLRLQNIEVQRPSPWLTDYEGLIKFVRDRSEAGIPIDRLLVRNGFPAPLGPEAKETLLKYVKHLTWL